MPRIISGFVLAFGAWAILWVGIEQIISAISPEWFGAHQAAFRAAIEHGDPFTPDTTILIIHIVLAAIVSVVTGFLAAWIAGKDKRAPYILGFLLLAVGLMKVAMSWDLVPVWYQIAFTAILLPLAIIGGKLRAYAQQKRSWINGRS